MNYIEPLKNISNVATNYLNWTKDNSETNILSNKEILKIASILNSNYIDNNLVELPKLVVVGTQSSGKSSLLNALIGIEILPVGKSMTTRTPLHLDLISSTNQESRLEFGYYNNLHWITEKKIIITYPLLTQEQKEQITHEIEFQTNSKAGSELNINSNPIYIKVYASNLPNLSLIDLPGLTSIAITDKGQPKDIKEQIIKLVSKYIFKEKILILAVIAARPDIEADMAMELIKSADPSGNRTIGVLTKLDLMNEDNDICNYLENNVSGDLKLKYGYFGIKNKVCSSGVKLNFQDIISGEKQYFLNHPVYRNDKYKSRLGIINLSINLSNILITNIKQCLPSVLTNINKQYEEVTKELISLGDNVPNNKELKFTMINNFISLYIKNFIQAIEHRGSIYQTGRIIKEKFDEFRVQIDNYNPFIEIENNYLLDILKSYDGLHMNFVYLPIEVLENTLKDNKIRPIYKLYEPSQKCMQISFDLLNDLNKKILEEKPFSKYPNFLKMINSIIINDVLIPKYQNCEIRIKELIEQEETLIWTDDKHFQQTMANEFPKIVVGNGNFNIDKFKLVLYEYYKTTVKNVRENVPKSIVYHLIKNTCNNLSTIMYEKILSPTIDINNLLDEYPEIEERRKILEKNSKDIIEIKKLIENIL